MQTGFKYPLLKPKFFVNEDISLYDQPPSFQNAYHITNNVQHWFYGLSPNSFCLSFVFCLASICIEHSYNRGKKPFTLSFVYVNIYISLLVSGYRDTFAVALQIVYSLN